MKTSQQIITGIIGLVVSVATLVIITNWTAQGPVKKKETSIRIEAPTRVIYLNSVDELKRYSCTKGPRVVSSDYNTADAFEFNFGENVSFTIVCRQWYNSLGDYEISDVDYDFKVFADEERTIIKINNEYDLTYQDFVFNFGKRQEKIQMEFRFPKQ